MAFLELHLRLRSSEQLLVETELEAVGSVAITLMDAEDTPILEPGVGETPMWPDVHLAALFEESREALDVLAALDGKVPPAVLHSARFARVDDRDWTRAWMDHYKPMAFGRRLWVYPWTESPIPDADKVVVRLEPGLAFGTGTHPTTALCLRWLDAIHLEGQSVLDFGCGTGILAIAALKLGARQAYGIDNDPQALLASHENAARNGVADRLLVLSDKAPAPPACDVLLANILLNPLLALKSQLVASVRPGGLAAFSGMLREQQEEFLAHYRDAFADLTVVAEQDWIRITGVRRQ
jgi:ribosomal protein L11 methyltransferase